METQPWYPEHMISPVCLHILLTVQFHSIAIGLAELAYVEVCYRLSRKE